MAAIRGEAAGSKAAAVQFDDRTVDRPATMPSVKVLSVLAGLAVLCTALGFVVFFALVREVGATRATVVMYLNPAVAVVAGVALLDEPFTLAMVSAFVMILFGPVPGDAPGHRSGGQRCRQSRGRRAGAP